MTSIIPRSLVAASRVKNYSLDELLPAVQKCMDLTGGLNDIVKPGSKVFVKINHLSPPSPPERGIVTHPIFTEAVIVLLKKTGADITVGDDIEENDADGFVLSGYREMCARQGVKLVNLRTAGFSETRCDGRVLKNIYLAKIALEADVIINLPKFKTHSLTTYTGGIKNMYGVIPAGLRRRFHGDYLRPEDFSQMLVDINMILKPKLTVMDGIMAMEGEGPGSGTMKNLGLILASRDVTALDAVAGAIIGLKTEKVLTTRDAGARGLGNSDLSKIDIAGETLDALKVTDFKLPATGYRTAMKRAPHGIAKYVLEQTSPRPLVKIQKCTACGKCVKACPAGAATIVNKKAAIDPKLCIRCMCCHEVCRYEAIYPGRPLLGKAVFGVMHMFRRH